jgi:hypothetical protein
MSNIKVIANKAVSNAIDEVNGRVLTRPALLITDGNGRIYAVDVDIGESGQALRNVPISRANREVCYAEVGNPCRLRRTANGQWEVVGFSQEMPGTYERFSVNISTLTFGDVEDLTLTSLPIGYGDLVEFGGGYGLVPYGSIATYRGGVLQGLSS